MKTQMKRAIAFFLFVLLTASTVLPISAEPASYSQTSNSGTRDEICTKLEGTGAEDYYTGSYSYDSLDDLSSSTLLTTLRKLMTDTHTHITSYDDCRDYSAKTDCENNDGRVSLIYTSYSATMSQYNGWNREHVWPKSLGGNNTSGGGADLHHIRPSDAVVNSTRGNKRYGYADGGREVYGNNPATGCLGGHYGTYYEPLDNVKGDVARIVLYVYVRWGSAWGADSVTEVFQSVDVLLEWCELDPVDTWEMGRNEVVENIQGNRNVFIDYPELAWLLFDEEIPADMVTPSGEAKGGNSSGDSTDDPTDTPVDPPVTPPVNPPVDPPVDPDSSTLQIVSQNLQFGDKIKLMYAVRAEELEDGQRLAIILYDANGDKIGTAIDNGIQNVKGEQLPTFVSSKGVSAQHIDVVIYAKAQILDGDTVVAESRSEPYSVLEYLNERLYVSTNVTDAQATMYRSLIAYAKMADQVLNKDQSIEALAYVSVNGDGGMYQIGEKIYPATDLMPGSGQTLAWDVNVNGVTQRYDASQMAAGYTVTEGYTTITPVLVAVTSKTYACDLTGFEVGNSYTSHKSQSGWQAVNAQYLKKIGDTENVILNGKTTAVGKLTSPTLQTGIYSLSFDYGNTYSESNGVDVTVNIYQNGKVVASTRLDNNSVAANTSYSFEWELENAVLGDFVIEIVNNSPTGSTSNKDRVCIWNITWVGNA